MEQLVRLVEVSKRYGEKIAVDQVSFSIPPGQVMGLLGPNGAGKTSIIRMITTITQPDAGRILFQNQPLSDKHQSAIGYLPEERGLYKQMFVGEHLIYLARLKGMEKAAARSAAGEWLEKLQLSARWGQRVEELSKGLQQQVQFIATVMHSPALIILDEPFSGLDPVNASRLKEEILRLRDEGAAIILSTHRMEQAESICQQIVLINQGKNILSGELSTIQTFGQPVRYAITYEGIWPAMPDESVYKFLFPRPGCASAQLPDAVRPAELISYLIHKGIDIQSFTREIPSLNEIFIRLVNDK